MFEFDLVFINIWRRDETDASNFSIVFTNKTSIDSWLDKYGKYIIVAFGVLGLILIITCVSCCYIKAKKDRAEIIQKHYNGS